MSVPEIRLRALNDRPVAPEHRYVLYWMTAFRRLDWNFALERAVEWARELGRPLVVLEALRCDYPWASDRVHRFVLDGMGDHARRLRDAQARYYPYVEPATGAGKGLLAALAKQAAVVVADDFPAFFHPRMLRAAGDTVPVRLEAVDANGLLPLAAADKAFARAYDLRRFMQRELPAHLGGFPREHPLVGPPLPGPASLPRDILRRWPSAARELEDGGPTLASLPIAHQPEPVTQRGGSAAAGRALARFLAERLSRYTGERNDPGHRVTSELSPYLHFGHISVHEVFTRLMEREGWSPTDLSDSATGSRSGWWGVGDSAEAFLDQLITWRELGFLTCRYDPGYTRYESLPEWARETLQIHAGDDRPHVYSGTELARAETHDRLWNAAQRQLLREGRIHNYLRMLWGKKILEWSTSPEEALEIMVDLNNRYGIDGRDPNSYSGISWVLGRYDRPWGPERPIFGKVRYMSSENARRKFDVRPFLARFGGEAGA